MWSSGLHVSGVVWSVGECGTCVWSVVHGGAPYLYLKVNTNYYRPTRSKITGNTGNKIAPSDVDIV